MNKIKFVARDKYAWEVFPKPYPASQALPNWWRDMTPYDKTSENPDGKKLIVRNFTANATFKKCTPMLDSLTLGYIVPLFADVLVRYNDSDSTEPDISWKIRGIDVFQKHGHSSREIPAPPGYLNLVYKYGNCWIPKTPKGYSVLITEPFGYKDLPFKPITGVIDSDKSTLEVVTPMWIKKGFEGVVEKGTPMFQVIPFKRDNWKAEFDYYENGEYRVLEDKNFNGTMVNHYIKNYWSKKTFK